MVRLKFRDFVHLLSQLHGSPTYVDVWNCQASWVIGNVPQSEFEDRLTEKQKEALDELANYVIYTVNDGAINISGQYQLDGLCYEILRKILEAESDEAVEEAIALIQKPTDQDIEELAREIIGELKKEEREHDLVQIYNSRYAMNCWDGCQGYHNITYLTQLGGKLYKCGDSYQAHHAICPHGGIWAEVADEEEALSELAAYISEVAGKYNYTKAELQDARSWFEDGMWFYECNEHGYYFLYEGDHGCPKCSDE